MAGDRIDKLLAMREKSPGDTRVMFALAMEYEHLERWDDAVAILREYLTIADDQGNAWGRLAKALLQIGRTDEAAAAYSSGVEAATRHGHPSMAAEFEEALEDIA